MDALQAHPWPGNVRELENVIERAVILAQDAALPLDEPLATRRDAEARSAALQTLEEVEHQYILRVLQETHWQIEGRGGAAARLGIHPSTLRSRMRQLGITRPRARH
jgi:DNA-binding NtrC family response regulator